jgi:hypothetical protein
LPFGLPHDRSDGSIPRTRLPSRCSVEGRGRFDHPQHQGIPRHSAIVVVLGVSVGLLVAAVGVSDVEPVPLWSVPAGLVLAGFGASAVADSSSWGLCLAAMTIAFVASAVGAGVSDAPVLVLWAPPIASIAVVLGQGLAAIPRPFLGSVHRARATLKAVGTLTLIVSFVPLPYALLARRVTVTADHSRGRAITERTGEFEGVRLGDTILRPERIMGAAPRWTPDQPDGPVAASSVEDGPSSLDEGGPPRDTFLRYPYVAFAIRDGRVRWIQIEDSSVAGSRGLGPGDSISLVKRDYPSARCSEDAIAGDDGSSPYPFCELRLRPHRWMTFFGSYRQPGTPITAIWLTTTSVE